MFSARHSGSRGTETSRWPPRAQRAISATVCSGSGTCSSTSIAVASANSPAANGNGSCARRIRYSRFGAVRCSQWRWIAGSSRSKPTTRVAGRAIAHWCVRIASPQPTSSTEPGSTRSNSSPSDRWNVAIRRRTTGLVEPYLS